MTQIAGEQVNTGMLKATRTLTDAEIKALPTTPVQIIPSPGAGKLIFPLAVILRGSFTGGAYTNVDADDGGLFLAAATSSIGSSLVNNSAAPEPITDLSIFLGAADHVAVLPLPGRVVGAGLFGTVVGDVSFYENLPLDIQAYNGGGNYTGGDAGNSLTVTVFYVIADV